MSQEEILVEVASRVQSRELLVSAMEAFDNAVVGYTNYSFTTGEQADKLCVAVAAI